MDAVFAKIAQDTVKFDLGDEEVDAHDREGNGISGADNK